MIAFLKMAFSLLASGEISKILGYLAAFVKFLFSLNEKWLQRQVKKRQDNAERAINEGDTREAERAIGNHNAGKPSGIGRLREP